MINDFIRVKLKEIFNLNDIFKKDNLNYKSNSGKHIVLVNIHYLFFFLKYIHERYLSLKDADNKQSNFATEL